MSATNGTTPAFDQADLEAIGEEGSVFLMETAEEEALLQALDFPALHLPDVDALTPKVTAYFSEIVVFQPPGYRGARRGHQLKRQLEAVGWKGQLALVPLPEETPSLQDLAAQAPDRQTLGIQLVSLVEDGIFWQIGPGRPRALPGSKLAEKIAAAWQGTCLYDVTRQRWLAYGATQPGIWGALPEVDGYDRVREALTPLVPAGFSWSLVQGVERLLRTHLKGQLPEPSRDWLPFPNGALHVPSLTLADHTPARGFTWCLPFAYTVLATCPTIDAWLRETQDQERKGVEDRVQVLLAYLKAIVTGRTDYQKFLELIGPGGTGKGTFLRLAHALVGWENAHASSLALLETNRFETANLEGKRLVLITDADRYGGPINTLKALTGGDPIRAERKHLDAYTFAPEALVLVAANEAIQSTDYTSGLARRRITVPFPHQPAQERQLLEFHRGQARGEFVPELPGLLNQVLAIPEAEMARLLRRTAEAVPSLQDAWRRALVETNPLAAWADACLVRDPTPELKTQIGLATDGGERLYPSYRRFAEDTGVKAIGLPRFPRLLDDFLRHQLGLPGVGWERDGQRSYIAGVRLRTPLDQETPGLIDASMAEQPASPADAPPIEPPKPVPEGSSGDGVGKPTRASREVREFRGFSQKSKTARPEEGSREEEQGDLYRKGFGKPPKPPEFPNTAAFPPEAPPSTPYRCDRCGGTEEVGALNGRYYCRPCLAPQEGITGQGQG
jgi:P4 family phage/plasmid primase-like protien